MKSLTCSFYRTDSQIVHKRIKNPDLYLTKFLKRRVNKILFGLSSDTCRYVSTALNPSDVGTREQSSKSPELLNLWLGGLEFFLQGLEEPKPIASVSTEQAISVSMSSSDIDDKDSLEKLNKTAPDFYTGRKSFIYLLAFNPLWAIGSIWIQRFYNQII